MERTFFHIVTVSIFILSPLSALSAFAESEYVGVSSCASSNCHGSIGQREVTSVLQNEYTTWYRHGVHSRAFETLGNAESKKIAANLGIGNPQQSEECLTCHTTWVPKSLRGKRFRLSDGVGCESCHGAASDYLKSHTSGRTHVENIKDGLENLASLDNRARICLECHHGNDERPMNHRLIGAGHPRLSFELDTFGILQPNHWRVDEDYVKRKNAYVPSQAWLLGQAHRANAMLKAIASKKRGAHLAMPEFSLSYCYSCHHSLEEDQWKSRSYGGRPGELRLNHSSLVMLRLGLEEVAPEIAKKVELQITALDDAYRNGTQVTQVENASAVVAEAIKTVHALPFKKATSRAILKRVVEYAANSSYLPYEVAEQVAMSITALVSHVHSGEGAYQSEIDELYNALTNEEGFNPSAFQTAAKKLFGKIKV